MASSCPSIIPWGRLGWVMASPTEQPDNELSQAVNRLNRIVKATKELNSTLDLSELARIILRIVRDEVGIERGTVFVMSQDRRYVASLAAQELDVEIRVQLGSGIAGTVGENGDVIDITDAYADDRFDQSFDARLGFRTNDIYCMPVRNTQGAIVGVLQLLNRSRDLTHDDEHFLTDISIHIGLAVENAAKHVRILEEERIDKQLELAREIMMITSVRTTRLLLGTLRLRCPLCLGGRVFKGLFGTRQT
jgi:GAF domain-containing protein